MKIVDQNSFIGRKITIAARDRAESEWPGVVCEALNELGCTISWSERGIERWNFIPIHNISWLGWRSAPGSEKEESAGPT